MIKQIQLSKVIKEILEKLISGNGLETSLEKSSFETDEGNPYSEFEKNRDSLKNYIKLLKEFH